MAEGRRSICIQPQQGGSSHHIDGQQIFDAVGDGMRVIDVDGNVLRVNDAFLQMAGLSREEATSGKCHDSFTGPACHTQNCPKHRIVRGEPAIEAETVKVLKEGRSRTYLVSAAPMSGSNGKVLAIIEVFRDITDRKRMEEELRRTTRHLRSRVKELDCLYGMSRLLQQKGVLLVEMLRKVPDLVASSWQHTEAACARVIVADQEFRTANFADTEWTQKSNIFVDGSLIGLVEVGYLEECPQADDGPFLAEERLLLNAVARRLASIVKHKWSESRLQESEARHKALVNALPDAVMTVDMAGRISYASPQAVRMHGYSHAYELVGKDALEFVAPQDRRAAKARVLRLLRGSHEGHHEILLAKSDGTHFPAEIAATVMKNGHDQPVAIVAVSRDVSERRLLERAVACADERVQQQVGRDLHDGLGQQLTGIACMCEVLKEDLASMSLDEAKGANNIAELAAEAASATRDMSRVLFGPDLRNEGLASALRGLARTTGGPFGTQFRIECEEMPVMTDPAVSTQIYRIAQEAAFNAVKHGRPKNVLIRIGAKKGAISLTVSDDGSGFSIDRHNGNGIGLAVMQSRARLVGGTVNIRTEPGAGTSIHCSIPIRAKEPASWIADG